MRYALRLVAALCVVAPALAAQPQKKEPPRPRLDAAADTNDPGAYYQLGLGLVERSPDKAVDAFHWAARLDPSSAEALYGERVATLLSDKRLLLRYWGGDRGAARDKRVMRADSLYLRALTLNPFFYRKLDDVLFRGVISAVALDAAGNRGNSIEIEYYIENYLQGAPPAMRAWRAYSNGRFDEALKLYAEAVKRERKKAGLRADRGRLFFQLDQADSALTELTLAADEMRKADKKDLVFVYQSKALMEHSLGLVQQRLGRTDAARESFGRALQEDLSFAAAHLQLAFMALSARDTATAVSELDLAVQIAADDAALLYDYGYTLHELGHDKEAEAQLRKAIAANDLYAAPHFVLAQALAAQGREDDAVAELRAFLALAPRHDLRRKEAEQLLAVVGGAE